MKMNRKSMFPLAHLLLVIVSAHCDGSSNELYNPLSSDQKYEGYSPSGWEIFFSNGPISAKASDFTKEGAGSVRVIAFMVHGVVLDYIVTDCNLTDTSAGLVSVNSSLRYFDRAVVFQDTADTFMMVKKMNDSNSCSEQVFKVGTCSDPQNCPSPPVSPINGAINGNASCEKLSEPLPPMMFLSDDGGIGAFQPASQNWMTYNPREPLGFVSREYKLLDMCFRLIVVTSKGRKVYAFKVTCGPVLSVTSGEEVLILENILFISKCNEERGECNENEEDEFVMMLSIPSRGCFNKAIYYVEGNDTVHHGATIPLEAPDCKPFVEGKMGLEVYNLNTTDENAVQHLRTTSLKNTWSNILNEYTASGYLLDYNIVTDMGMMFQTHKSKEGVEYNVVSPVVQGLQLTAILLNTDTPMRLITKKNEVFYGTDVHLKKLDEEDEYQILEKTGNGCSRRLFKIQPESTQDGRTVRTVSNTTDSKLSLSNKDCQSLVEGTYIQEDQKLNFGVIESS